MSDSFEEYPYRNGIVRCRDCEYSTEEGIEHECWFCHLERWNAAPMSAIPVDSDAFCSWGKERSNRFEQASNAVNIGKVATFPDVKPDKAQALKVLEEAAEVFGAWQAFNADQDGNTSAIFILLDECADVIQAVSNLVAALNVVNFAPYMDDYRERNEERGRL